MSFYVTLPSKEGFSYSNLGTEYRTTLPHPIVLKEDDWHVAMVNMQYVGQKWGKLSLAERTMEYSYVGPETIDYVVTCETWPKGDAYINFDTERSACISKGNYTYDQFFTALFKIWHDLAKFHWPDELVLPSLRMITSMDNDVTVRHILINSYFTNNENEFYFTFSPCLIELLQLQKFVEYPVYPHKYAGVVQMKCYNPLPVVYSSNVNFFLSHNTTDTYTLKISGGMLKKLYTLEIPHGYWTPYLLTNYINTQCKTIQVAFTQYSESLLSAGVYESRALFTWSVIKPQLSDETPYTVIFSKPFLENIGASGSTTISQFPALKESYAIVNTLLVQTYKAVSLSVIKSSFGSMDALCK